MFATQNELMAKELMESFMGQVVATEGLGEQGLDKMEEYWAGRQQRLCAKRQARLEERQRLLDEQEGAAKRQREEEAMERQRMAVARH